MVREALGSPAASNRGETALTCAAVLGEILAMPGLGSRLGASVGFLVHMRTSATALRGWSAAELGFPGGADALHSNGDASVVAAGCGGDGVVRWVYRGHGR